MSWEIYVNTKGNHFKFWSIELDNKTWSPTGKIIYGKIGSSGVSHYNRPSIIGKRRTEKLDKGYVFLKVDRKSPQVHSWDVRN